MEDRRERSMELMRRVIAAEAEIWGRAYGAAAKVAKRTGLSTSFISNVVNGNADIGPLTAPTLAKAYPQFGLELYELAGLEAPASVAQPALKVPPGSRWITDEDTPLPVGPTASAHDSKHPGDESPEQEMVNLGELFLSSGANYAIRVEGDCLHPIIEGGDLVAVRIADRAADGRIVVARLTERFDRGELGGGFTIKVWHPSGPMGGGYCRADGTQAFGTYEARIVGVVEFVIHSRPPVVALPAAKPIPLTPDSIA